MIDEWNMSELILTACSEESDKKIFVVLSVPELEKLLCVF
jgi:hypothetical protein